MLELAGIIVLGIFAQWIAWKVKIPAILPLILIGLAVGPLSTLYPEGFVLKTGRRGFNPSGTLKKVSSQERACFILFP